MQKKFPRENRKTGALFFKAVYAIVSVIPKGRVMTYAAVARRAGNPRAARAVGNAMRKNERWPDVPCHRVIPSSGLIGKWSGRGGSARKKRLLLQEGVRFDNGRVPERWMLT